MAEKIISATKRNVPPNLQSLKGFAGGAAVNLAKYQQRMAVLNAERGLKLAEIKSQVGQVGGDNAQVEKNYSDWLSKHRKGFSNGVWAMARELDDARLSVTAAKPYLTNPIALAQSYNLGEEKRSRIAAEISGLGPAALKNLAAKALAGNDKDMVAALVSLNDRTPTKERSFSSTEISEQVFGEDAATAKKLIEDVEWAAESSLAQTRQFEGTAINKLVLAMRFPGRTLPKVPEPLASEKPKTGVAARMKAMAVSEAD